MKYVALLSGGKDSCYNICCAQSLGHSLVAAVNLHPKNVDPEETDSWMFQTVGSNVVEHIAECLDVPLYRRALTGDPGQQNDREEDEDLEAVIKMALDQHPEIVGVSVGAIASTYQQIRVDRVCAKLGLTVLSFMWQRDQVELLDEMVNAQIDAKIIKVAGFGLDQTILGLSLAQAQPKLLRLHKEFGCHPCGEGGEFETICVDAPVFKKRLIIENPQVLQHQEGDNVYYLSFEVSVVPKDVQQQYSFVPPPLISPQFSGLLKSRFNPSFSPPFDNPGLRSHNRKMQCLRFEGDIDQVFANLERDLGSRGSKMTEIYHVHIWLKSLADFQLVNQHYNEVIYWQEPPSRVAVGRDSDKQVKVAVSLAQGAIESKCVHVQGRSFWAPASIGPYSQARLIDGVGHIAGQIALNPRTLELENDPECQVLLSLQNALRVASVLHNAVDEQFQSVYFVVFAAVYVTDATLVPLVNEAWNSLGSGQFLLTIYVPELPRGALVEWVIKTADRSSFGNFITETEEDDLYWCWPPVRSVSASWFGFQSFHVLETEPQPEDGIVYLSVGPGNPKADMSGPVWLNSVSKENIWIVQKNVEE